MPPSDRLDHLDRDELVVAATQLAVVLHQHRDPVAQSRAADLLDGVIVLLARDRRRGHVAAARCGSVQRERAPARSDLEHTIPRTEVELLTDALELRDLRLLERHPLLLEERTRVAHRRIEHPLEQLVAEVVVRGDVAPAPALRAATQKRPGPLQRPPQRRETRAQPVQAAGVARSEPDQRHQIGRVPQALGKGLSHSAAAVQQHPPRPRGGDLDGCSR